MHTVILSRQIGHYHNARYSAAARVLSRLTVLSLANEGGFAEFLAKETDSYAVERVFAGKADYLDAVRSGKLVAAVQHALDRLAPQVVVVSGWAGPESMAAILWARVRKIPLVMMSESQADDAARSPLRELMKGRIVQACDAGFVGGPVHASYMEQLGMPASRISLGYNAVDNVHFAREAEQARGEAAAQRRQHGLPERYVLASARFIEKKNLPDLVRAYHEARQSAARSPDLMILGDGEQRGAIEAAVTETGLGGVVHLPGFRGYDVLPVYYGLSEGFAHVSRVEQWGLVVNEAMASGVPVVVSNRCGIARTVVQDEEHGWLVDPFSISDMAAGLRKLFDLDDGQRRDMGQRARQGIAAWGPEQFGAGLKSAIDTACSARRRGGLAPWDRMILQRMAQRFVEDVA